MDSPKVSDTCCTQPGSPATPVAQPQQMNTKSANATNSAKTA